MQLRLPDLRWQLTEDLEEMKRAQTLLDVLHLEKILSFVCFFAEKNDLLYLHELIQFSKDTFSWIPNAIF